MTAPSANTVLTSRNLLIQRNIVEDTSAQDLMRHIKEDTSSLILLCDSESFMTKRTQITTATSNLSLNFEFDDELLQHKAYKRTLRSLMRKSRNKRKQSARPLDLAELDQNLEKEKAAAVSATIDRALRVDRKVAMEKRVNLLLMGSGGDGLLADFDSMTSSATSSVELRSDILKPPRGSIRNTPSSQKVYFTTSRT